MGWVLLPLKQLLQFRVEAGMEKSGLSLSVVPPRPLEHPGGRETDTGYSREKNRQPHVSWPSTAETGKGGLKVVSLCLIFLHWISRSSTLMGKPVLPPESQLQRSLGDINSFQLSMSPKNIVKQRPAAPVPSICPLGSSIWIFFFMWRVFRGTKQRIVTPSDQTSPFPKLPLGFP